MFSGLFTETFQAPFLTAGGVTFSAEAQQYFDRLLTNPTDDRANLIAACIDTIVASGAWSRLDALYLYASADEGSAGANLISASFPSVSLVGPTDFVVDRGFYATGLNQWIWVPYFPATSAVNYTRNDGMIAQWSLTSTAFDNTSYSTNPGGGGSNNLNLWPRATDNNTYWAVNSSLEVFSNTDASGLFLSNRTGASVQAHYRNGSLADSGTIASSALTTNQLIPVYSRFRIASFAIGASLDANQRTSVYTALQTYLTGIGAI